jgi:hypothetical protein
MESESKEPDLNARETNNFLGDFVHYQELLSSGKEVKDFFENLLEGKPIVDLGCGPVIESEIRKMEKFALGMGASRYIGVDKFRVRADEKPTETSEYVSQDMLEYTQSLPDNSENFVLNGIDEIIIVSEDYADRLVEQLARVTAPNGVAMGFNSPILHKLHKYGFNPIKVPVEDSWLEIWQKQKENRKT